MFMPAPVPPDGGKVIHCALGEPTAPGIAITQFPGPPLTEIAGPPFTNQLGSGVPIFCASHGQAACTPVENAAFICEVANGRF